MCTSTHLGKKRFAHVGERLFAHRGKRLFALGGERLFAHASFLQMLAPRPMMADDACNACNFWLARRLSGTPQGNTETARAVLNPESLPTPSSLPLPRSACVPLTFLLAGVRQSQAGNLSTRPQTNAMGGLLADQGEEGRTSSTGMGLLPLPSLPSSGMACFLEGLLSVSRLPDNRHHMLGFKDFSSFFLAISSPVLPSVCSSELSSVHQRCMHCSGCRRKQGQ